MTDTVSIIRTPHSKERPYFSMARFSAQDESLSWEARGVLAYLLSKPDDWQVQIKDLQQKCGRDKVRSVLKELVDAKYLTVKQEHDTDTGRFLRNVYKVYEVPFTENPSTDNPITENPTHTYKRTEQSTDRQPPNPRKRGNGEQVASDSFPAIYQGRLWTRKHIDAYSAIHGVELKALITARGDGNLYASVTEMPKPDALQYIEAHAELAAQRVNPADYESLYVYTRATLSWRRNPTTPLDMVVQLTNWRKSRETRGCIEATYTPVPNDYPRIDDFLSLDQNGNYIGAQS